RQQTACSPWEVLHCLRQCTREADDTGGFLIKFRIAPQASYHRFNIRRRGAELLEVPLVQRQSGAATGGGNFVTPRRADLRLRRLWNRRQRTGRGRIRVQLWSACPPRRGTFLGVRDAQ